MSIARTGQPGHPLRRGFATALVLWAVAIASIMLVSLQVSAWRQAASGREEVARVRARWAARAGVEAMIARLQTETQQSQPVGAGALVKALANDAEGALQGAAFVVGYTEAGQLVPGARDTGSLLNINLMARDDLMLLQGMTDDMADAILAWMGKSDGNSLGIYSDDYYRAMPMGYVQRNAPIRSLAELELIAGVTPDLVRGEDWNLNGILDANENDGDATWPPDNADGTLDRGWSAVITASSGGEGLSPAGVAKLDLLAAQSTEIAALIGVDSIQADAIHAYAAMQGAAMEEFIRTDLSTLNTTALTAAGTPPVTTGRNRAPVVRALTSDQLATLYDGCSIGPPLSSTPGKININTVSRDSLQYLASLQPSEADAIVAYRDSSGGEVASIVDLLNVQGFTATRVADLAKTFSVRTTVFTLTSRGRDAATGTTVEITAEIDRSRLPVVIRSLTVR